MKIGLNVFESDVINGAPEFEQLTRRAALDFVVCHFDPDRRSVAENCSCAQEAARKFRSMGLDFIANFEFQNFRFGAAGTDGYEWCAREDGSYRLRLPPEYVQALSSQGNLMGIMLDEFEHTITNHECSFPIAARGKASPPVFSLPDGLDAVRRGQLITEKLAEYRNELGSLGIRSVSGEHVFPILYHSFAKADILPCFKAQKESFTPVQYAIAAGAALQYGKPLRCCVDMWFMRTHPGHSAEEMYNNLLFAYHAGVSEVYVESIAAMYSDGSINDTGEAFIRFTREYKGRPRSYEISDYTPGTGIIRFDDGCWGQSGILWKRMLLGDPAIKPDRRAREWLHVFHLLTRGKTCINGINWGRMTLWSLRRHRSFCPLTSAAVFDGTVRYDTLRTLRLCFLCGEYISPETLGDVARLVRENGLTVVTSRRFAPSGIKRSCRDGKGRWLITRSFLSPLIYMKIRSLLPRKNEIGLAFGDKKLRMKISGDGDSIKL